MRFALAESYLPNPCRGEGKVLVADQRHLPRARSIKLPCELGGLNLRCNLLSNAQMFLRILNRFLATVDKRCAWLFIWNFGVKGAMSVYRFKRRLRRGEYFPPFLYISITSRCNLRCQGCWVDVAGPERRLELEELDRVVREAKAAGNSFFGLLGGEPFLHPLLLELLEAHGDCYFQIFSNGHFITERVAQRLRELGNATPLISIEGRELVSDLRRGGREVFNRSLRGVKECVKAGLITGVATSVCQNNIDELLTELWLRELIELGVHYVWFYVFRPSGPNPGHELALRPEQQLQVRRFVVEMRKKMPIVIVDSYYDHRGVALCPMTTGISHHIGPGGDIEPCPVIQFAVENVRDGHGLYQAITSSAFLRDFRSTAARTTRGCILLERPDLVKQLVLKHGARDTTTRQTAMKELEAMQPRVSQWLPGREIPEQHWMYRFVKRQWFHDFGAYDTVLDESAGADRINMAFLTAEGSGCSSSKVGSSSLEKHV